MSGPVVALCGGVGGAKLAHGLALALPPDELTIVVNTGDDFRHLGLHVSPDLDSVMYALADLSDPVRGWGRRDETWAFMRALESLGGEGWFRLGDGDLATHVERSWRLERGETLSHVTERLCTALGIRARVLPMSDDPIRTRVLTDEGWLDFQEYFVRRRCEPRVRGFSFAGVESGRPQPQVLQSLQRSDLRAIVICPSNPFVSIDPILAVAGVRAALQQARAPVIAVTPIIGGKAIKGPAAKMLQELGFDVTGIAVAHRYADITDAFVVDAADSIDGAVPGVHIVTAPTLMSSVADRLQLAREVLRIADTLVAS